MEIELKLVVPPDAPGRLRRGALLRDRARSRLATRTLHSVYYDTPEHELGRSGAALRLRKTRNHWVQTFKHGGSAESGLHSREEHETPTPAQILNLPALLATPAAGLFSDARIRDRLAPVFTTDFRRTTCVVEIAPGETAELAIDIGTIGAAGRTLPIHEIELELLSGSPRNLFAFARALLGEIDFRLENTSKAERGYRLARNEAAQPVRASPPRLTPDMSWETALATILGSCLNQLQANDQGVIESEDPEFIHQARVAIRRLRSAFSVFRPVLPDAELGDLRDRFRGLGNALGSARDWDVFVAETMPAVLEPFGNDPALVALLDAARACQRSERDVASVAISDRAYAALLLDLAAWMARDPAPSRTDSAAGRVLPVASSLLARQHRRTRRAGKSADRAHPESLHALRIQIKKLRYAVEFFGSLYSTKAVRRFAGGLAALQDILGGLNDAAVTARLLDDAGMQADPLSYGRGIVRGWTAARAEAGLVHFDDAWARFRHLRPFW